MIQTKEDLNYYLEEDKKALGIKRKRPPLFGAEIWKYQISLRKLEFYTNVHNVNCVWIWMGGGNEEFLEVSSSFSRSKTWLYNFSKLFWRGAKYPSLRIYCCECECKNWKSLYYPTGRKHWAES